MDELAARRSLHPSQAHELIGPSEPGKVYNFFDYCQQPRVGEGLAEFGERLLECWSIPLVISSIVSGAIVQTLIRTNGLRSIREFMKREAYTQEPQLVFNEARMKISQPYDDALEIYCAFLVRHTCSCGYAVYLKGTKLVCLHCGRSWNRRRIEDEVKP